MFNKYVFLRLLGIASVPARRKSKQHLINVSFKNSHTLFIIIQTSFYVRQADALGKRIITIHKKVNLSVNSRVESLQRL